MVTMILDYLRLRRLGISHRAAAEISNLYNLFESFKAAAFIIAALIGLLAVHSWAVNREVEELEQRVEQESKTLEQMSKIVAELLNGHPVIDTATGTAYFIETSEQKGL